MRWHHAPGPNKLHRSTLARTHWPSCRAVLLSISVAVTVAAAPVSAAPSPVEPSPSSAPRPPHALDHTSAPFLAAELGGSIALALTLSLASGSSAARCSWCEPDSLDVSVRSALFTHDSRTPALTSHILSLGAAPLLAFGGVVVPALASGHGRYAVEDSVVILDGFILVSGFADLSKKMTARQRPSFHYGRQSQTESANDLADANRSFFSGDTAWPFTLASSASALAYSRGYVTAPWLVAGGAAIGVSTGMLRMVADMHWFTDVLTGAAVGVGTGLALPLLLHRRAAGGAEVATILPVVTRDLTGVVARGRF